MSIADPSALQAIYSRSGHGSPTKSDLYSAFNNFPGAGTIFTTRSREVHARKRKLLAHTFALKSVPEFEPVVQKYHRILLRHWDRMCAAAVKGEGGVIGECEWKARDDYAFLNCLVCESSCIVSGPSLTVEQGSTFRYSISLVCPLRVRLMSITE